MPVIKVSYSVKLDCFTKVVEGDLLSKKLKEYENVNPIST